jgi:hypothetical protein
MQGGETLKVRGKVTSSFDGDSWDYTVSVNVKEVDGKKQAEQLLGRLMEATGQTVLAEAEA